MFTPSIKIKDLFFDRKAVIDALDPVTKQALSASGAAIRSDAMSSIKPRAYGVTAPPGQPPYDHVGFARVAERRRLKKFGRKPAKRSAFQKGLKAILFGYDPSTRSVVVGPLGHSPEGGKILQAIEEGGPSVTGSGARRRVVHLAGNPFMKPALNRELPNLPQRWSAKR